MEQVTFIDPFGSEGKQPSTPTPEATLPVPVPSGRPPATPPVARARGREHELRRLIDDLAALASRNSTAVKR
ncbi:hypothetical protein [Pseudarthrobacter sp. NS4]|uniref:hypothetical protein n=1 Tax=Pseudarthrobacter sp. NS4 TaxID=2973976 RepID=UPI002162059D|nr:hypothetical protein [Pseudarthrobacter sp. NS4]